MEKGKVVEAPEPGTVFVPLDGENFRWITNHAKRENRSKADILRQLLGEYRRMIESQKAGVK